jgi:hypothetical protein
VKKNKMGEKKKEASTSVNLLALDLLKEIIERQQPVFLEQLSQ